MPVVKSRLSLGVMLSVACLCASASAEADIVFCNEYSKLVYIAIAYPQTDGTWMSRGWMSLKTGECGTFDTAIRVNRFYFRGESEWYRKSGKRIKDYWGKDKKFAIWDNDNFQYWNAEERVLNSKLESFVKGPENDDEPVACTITFNDDKSIGTKMD